MQGFFSLYNRGRLKAPSPGENISKSCSFSQKLTLYLEFVPLCLIADVIFSPNLKGQAPSPLGEKKP